MKKIAHVHQIKNIQLPKEIETIIQDTAKILNESYGVDRDVDGGDGGYIIIIENEIEIELLKNIHLNVKSVIPEYIDIIECKNGATYINTLILLSSDYAIHLIFPLDYIVHTGWANELPEPYSSFIRKSNHSDAEKEVKEK